MSEIKFLDGANGTCLWAKTDDKGPVWRYNEINPAIVRELAEEYIQAGSNFILSNTFSANRPSVEPFGFEVESIVRKGVAIAKEVAGDRAKVLLDIGPLTGLLEPFGNIKKEEAKDMYKVL